MYTSLYISKSLHFILGYMSLSFNRVLPKNSILLSIRKVNLIDRFIYTLILLVLD
jgi:hypothetical protein